MLPEQALATATSPADMLCAQAYLRYKRALQAYNALDFDDLILLPTVLFEHSPGHSGEVAEPDTLPAGG